MKKKIGTLMENGLIGKAKEAALKENIPFHRLIERAVEKYLNQRHSPGIEERTAEYAVNTVGENPGTNPESGIDRNPLAEVMVSPEERRKRVLSLAGKYHSGRTDIAGRHDDYAAETYKE